MKKNTKKMMIWLLGAAMLSMTACSAKNTAKTTQSSVETSQESTQAQTKTGSESTGDAQSQTRDLTKLYGEEDLKDTWEESESTMISLNNADAEIKGEGAKLADGILTISAAGTYVLSGHFQGQVVIAAGEEDVVHLVLNGAEISNDQGSAIYASSGKKVVLTLAAGTENTVSDGSTYSDISEDAPDAAIYVKNDLTINGSGSLTLTGNSQSALKVKDNLVILAGTLDITAADKGIKGSDSVAIEDGNLTISAKDDAITTEGALSFYNGSLFIKESAEGMEGVQVLIAGGNIDITSSDDGINARGLLEETATDEEKEAYGMENQPDTYLKITGGVVSIKSEADAIDSNGQVYMEGGGVYISGPESGGNASLDYNGEAVISGGVFMSAGTSDMFQSFSSSSTQNYIEVFYDSAQTAGTKITVTDESGKELASLTPTVSFSAALISLPDFATGSKVTVTTGSDSQEVTLSAGANRIGNGSGGFGGGPQGGPPGNGRGGSASNGGASLP